MQRTSERGRVLRHHLQELMLGVGEGYMCHPPSFLQSMLEEEQEDWVIEDSTKYREDLTGPLPSTQS